MGDEYTLCIWYLFIDCDKGKVETHVFSNLDSFMEFVSRIWERGSDDWCYILTHVEEALDSGWATTIVPPGSPYADGRETIHLILVCGEAD